MLRVICSTQLRQVSQDAGHVDTWIKRPEREGWREGWMDVWIHGSLQMWWWVLSARRHASLRTAFHLVGAQSGLNQPDPTVYWYGLSTWIWLRRLAGLAHIKYNFLISCGRVRKLDHGLDFSPIITQLHTVTLLRSVSLFIFANLFTQALEQSCTATLKLPPPRLRIQTGEGWHSHSVVLFGLTVSQTLFPDPDDRCGHC